ncbi:MAG: ergothioneine biosynthesis protein EgtB [Gammaproteobacteria bacterium]
MSLIQRYQRIRQQSLALCRSLSAEDMTAQSMPDASPAKWHLAHTTWFFETFLLLERGHKPRNPDYQFLFNSYYHSKGAQYRRPLRGLITRPGVAEIIDYRTHVDAAVCRLLEEDDPQINQLVETGLHHEMQHQELMLTDILHLFSLNPLLSAIFESGGETGASGSCPASTWREMNEQLAEVGRDRGDGFVYDCECPRHKIWLTPFSIQRRLVTNAEWLEFIEDGGYGDPLLWLSDGWSCKEKNNWHAPAYWQQKEGCWMQYGLDGLQVLQADAPVCHVSYYEAQAYARWASKRLPREHELEVIARAQKIDGNFLESDHWRPRAVQDAGANQLYGDVWEWTGSAFQAYPGFKAEQGALAEYNGKFMCNQLVLRGGSCVTPIEQLRSSYRNFFYPWQRWQFTGLRLARDD